MKRAVPWIRVAGFIVGLVVLVAIFDYAFAQTGYVRYVLTYFQNSDEDIDTLVLGASHARSAIDPQKIDDVNDTNSFSLAIPGEMVKDSYYVLQEACRSKKIKTLIFDVDYQYWMEPQAEEYSEVLAEVLKGHFNGTLDETKYFYNTFDEMYKEMEEQ